MRKPSPATELRRYKIEYRRQEVDLMNSSALTDTYRARVTKAEQEIIEWKLRFDALLKIVPEKLA